MDLNKLLRFLVNIDGNYGGYRVAFFYDHVTTKIRLKKLFATFEGNYAVSNFLE